MDARFYCFLPLLWCVKAQAVDPFEDFHDYGKLSEEEIHSIHKGDLFYGDTEFGFIVTRGNTDSTSFKLKGNVYQDLEHWRNQFKFDSLYRRDRDLASDEYQLSASRLFGSVQGNYKLGEKNASFFIYGDYEADEFSGLNYKATLASGYGNRLYQSAVDKLDFDIGPGLHGSESDQGEKNFGYLLRLALQWERLVSDNTRFNQSVSAEQSLSGLNSRLKSETALISQVLGAVSLKFSYLFRYSSKPEAAKEATDSELSATLVYSF